MGKLKTWHFFVGALLCYIISFVLLSLAPEDSEGTFSVIIGLLGLVLLIVAFIKLSRGKIPTDRKIVCPHCQGQGREYRSTTIKILYPLLFLTPKYICTECKKLFNNPYQPKDDTNLKNENN